MSMDVPPHLQPPPDPPPAADKVDQPVVHEMDSSVANGQATENPAAHDDGGASTARAIAAKADTAPPADDTAPPVDETAPSTDDQAIPPDGQTSAVDESMPSDGEAASRDIAAEEAAAAATEEVAAADEAADSQGNAVIDNMQDGAAQGLAEDKQDAARAAQLDAEASAEQPPSDETPVETGDTEQPVSETQDGQPIDEQVQVEDEAPVEEQVSVDDEAPADEQPPVDERVPEDEPAVPEDQPPDDQPPADERPPVDERVPEDEPAVPEDQPPDDQPPADDQGALGLSDQQPDEPDDTEIPTDPEGTTDRAEEQPADRSTEGDRPQTPMDRWEAAEDRIMAENIVSLRQEADILRKQGNYEGAEAIEGFISKLPVSDDIKADPQGYLESLESRKAAGLDLDTPPADVTSEGDRPQTPMDRWEVAEDRIMAENIVSLRQEADILRKQGNYEGAEAIEGFISKLPVSDDIKADPQGYLDNLEGGRTAAFRSEASPAGETGGEATAADVPNQSTTQESAWQWADDPAATSAVPPPDLSSPALPQERVPTGDTKLEGIWSDSQPIANGRSFVPSWDKASTSASHVVGKPGEYTAVIHGSPEVVGMREADNRVTLLTPKEMADLIRSDPDWHGEPVRLVACNTGALPDSGDECFGQQLAEELGTEVWAPSKYAFGSHGNGWSSSVYRAQDPYTLRDALYARTTPQRPDGWFYRFKPTGRGASR